MSGKRTRRCRRADLKFASSTRRAVFSTSSSRKCASISRERATKTAYAQTIHTLEEDIKTADALIVSLKAAIHDKKLQSDAARRRRVDDTRTTFVPEERRTHEIGMEIERVDKTYVTHTHELHDVQENSFVTSGGENDDE